LAARKDKKNEEEAKLTKGTKGTEFKKEKKEIDPLKAFQMTSAAVETKFAETAYHAWLHDAEKMKQYRFSSGSISVDTALGGEGLPYGRIIEVWGPSQSGKTSWALETAWHLQRRRREEGKGYGVVFMDIEHKFDRRLLYQWRGGFLPEATKFEEPFTGDAAFGMLLHYVESMGTCMVIVDSVSAIRSSEMLDKDDQKTNFGAPAKLIGDWLPKISTAATMTGVPIMFVNQVRAKLDAGPKAMGRAKLRKYGGMAYDHWVCVSLYLGKSTVINDGLRDLGHMAKMVIYKNHSGPTMFKEFKLKLDYGRQFDTTYELVDRATQLSIISGGAGGHYKIGDVAIHGKDNLYAEVRGNLGLQSYLWDEIMKMQVHQPLPETDLSTTSWAIEDEGVEITLDDHEEGLLEE